MKKLKLSVVVPILGKVDFIDEALASLFNQQGIKRNEMEVIVVESKLAVGATQMVKRYSGQLAHWESTVDGTQSAVLSKGFSLATGDIFTWLSPGNFMESWTVREVLDFFKTHEQAHFVYGDVNLIDEEGTVRLKKEIPFNWYIWLYDHNYIPQAAAFWTKQIYEDVGGIKEIAKDNVESYLWAKFAQRTHLYHVDRPWARVRWYSKPKNHYFHVKNSLEDGELNGQLQRSLLDKGKVLINGLMAKIIRAGWKLVIGRHGK
jgi:glycosyltransferase involved in cell wall biosynthesis